MQSKIELGIHSYVGISCIQLQHSVSIDIKQLMFVRILQKLWRVVVQIRYK